MGTSATLLSGFAAHGPTPPGARGTGLAAREAASVATARVRSTAGA
jgi:2-polyprenyl-6-methoxyphenol hydroxylase-like FAD-dependent oxidoreductase